jgi:CDP-2,3-bis-(O-geranylgeranyl)-sn-glycerol synthase
LDYIASILHFLSEGFWFYLPVLAANVSVYAIWSFLGISMPLDLYKEIGKKRIIGDGRDISGLFFILFICILIGIFQNRAEEAIYLGIGGCFGTWLSSFIKRRFGLKRGTYCFIIDQTDFVLGASLFYVSQYTLSLNIFLGGLIMAFILHHGVNLLRKIWERGVKILKDENKK